MPLIIPLLLVLAAPKSSPAMAVTEFVNAWNRQDFRAMSALTVSHPRARAAAMLNNALPIYAVRKAKQIVHGSSATVWVTLHVRTVENSYDVQDNASLQLSHGKWLLNPTPIGNKGLRRVVAPQSTISSMFNSAFGSPAKLAAPKIATL